MKFLCVECDAPMQLAATEGPEEGSLTVTFGCPACGRRVAMLTNPSETQLIRSLGVKVGGRTAQVVPFEHIGTSLARRRAGAFDPEPGSKPRAATGGQLGDETAVPGPGCPLTGMVAAQDSTTAGSIRWAPEALARAERIPSFIRPMAKTAIERYAEGKGYGTITLSVMDEARAALGM